MNQCLKKIRYQKDLRKRDAGRVYHSAHWASLLGLIPLRLAVVGIIMRKGAMSPILIRFDGWRQS